MQVLGGGFNISSTGLLLFSASTLAANSFVFVTQVRRAFRRIQKSKIKQSVVNL